MAWAFEELVRVHVEVLAMSSTEDLWDRVEHAFWLRREIERETSTEKQRDFRSRQHGRLYHRDYERARRQRGKQVEAVVRCCAVCRRMFTLSATQLADGTRYCSRTCGAKFNYHHRGNTGRKPRMVTIGGMTRSLPDWADHYEIAVSLVYRRMREGMSEAEALTTPKKKTSGRRRKAA